MTTNLPPRLESTIRSMIPRPAHPAKKDESDFAGIEQAISKKAVRASLPAHKAERARC
jgi:hypothetical protein